MFSVISRLINYPPADPVRLPLMSPPWHGLLILSAYLYFVFKLGKDWMECRKPYNVKRAMLIYNLCQVVYNTIMFGMMVYYMFIDPFYDFRCMEKLPFDDPKKTIERYLHYAYFLNKVLDLMDTVFFVLRKSYKQITVLHIYHHCMMVFFGNVTYYLYGTAGQYITLGLLNTFVHMIMYFYYFVTARYPQMKGSLWWKKYITKVQLVQFLVLGSQAVLVLTLNPSCGFPRLLQYLQLIQAVVMLTMFGNFYYKAYVRPVKKM